MRMFWGCAQRCANTQSGCSVRGAVLGLSAKCTENVDGGEAGSVKAGNNSRANGLL